MLDRLRDALRAHPFSHGLDEQAFERLIVAGSLVAVPPDSRLITSGTLVETTFLVHDGRLDLRLPGVPFGREAFDSILARELIGWSWLNGPTTWHFDAVAIGPATVIALDGAILLTACHSDPAFGFELARRFLAAATRRLERARLVAVDPYSGPR